MEQEVIRYTTNITKEEFFNRLPEFKEWVEQTHLFTTIKQMVGTGVRIDMYEYQQSLELTGVIKIEKVEDLPIELLWQFYINSPFYEDRK